MIKRQLFFLGLLISSATLCGQNFTEKYFTNTDWFSNEKDSIFYKADTIRFIKYKNYGPEFTSGGKKEYLENESKYLNSAHYVKLSFKKNKKINFYEIHLIEFVPSLSFGGATWKFDKTNQILTININNRVISFRLISEKQIKIESRLSTNTNTLTTIEVTGIRIND